MKELGDYNLKYLIAAALLDDQQLEEDRIQAPDAQAPDLLNSRFGYVSVSRAGHEATIFTSDAAKLGQQIGTEINKSSAFELAQNQPVHRSLGLAQLFP